MEQKMYVRTWKSQSVRGRLCTALISCEYDIDLKDVKLNLLNTNKENRNSLSEKL